MSKQEEDRAFETKFLTTALLKSALLYAERGGTKEKWLDITSKAWDHMEECDKTDLNAVLYLKTKEEMKKRGIEILRMNPDEVD